MVESYKQYEPENSIVEEAALHFEQTESILRVVSLRAENHLSSTEKMKIVHSGIPKSDLVSLKTKTKLDYTELAKVLAVTRATLINKKNNEKFNMSLSERILDIADLYSFGFEIFGDEESFIQWMKTPNRALGYQLPLNFIDNQFGREEVRNLIGRIAYGVYS